jgi:cytochrome c-type biogenesis protein CcmI
VDSGSEVAFYTAQLAEIARDVDRGLLPADEASAARAETGRKLLAARVLAHDAPAPASRFRGFATVLVALALPALAVGLYMHFGEPALAGAPQSAPENAAQENAAQAPDPVTEALERIEAEAKASPDNEKAWAALAPAYIRLGRYSDAIAANRNLLRLRGEDGTIRANLGEAEVAAAGGKVTDEARADFQQALADDPNSVMARFYLGLASEQAGDTKKALEAYEPLIEASRDHPHWVAIIQARIAALKGAAQPSAPAASASAGIPDSQKAMVNTMVTRLATRLAQSGGTLDDWTRLARSYVVLDEKDKAREAVNSARKALGADAAASARLDALAQEINQAKAPEAPPTAPAPAPSAAPAAAPAAAAKPGVPDSQKDMVNAMVNRLATRLAQSGGSVDDWTRLAQSYVVLGDKDKAVAAVNSARKALGGDASAVAKLDALEQEINQDKAPEEAAASAPAPAPEAPAIVGVPDSQRDMVNAMVNRLATRLAQSGGSVDDWARLVRSYVVLDDKDKAMAALGSARKALGGDSAAVAKLDSLAQELNLGKP